MKRQHFWVLPVVLALSVVSLAFVMAYLLTQVEVKTGERVICSDSQHQGEAVLRNDVKTIKVPRREAGQYKVVEKEVICPACQARRAEEEKQARIRREREEREARARAEVEEIMSSLRVEFGIGYGITVKTSGVSYFPGDCIILQFKLTNNGSSPIRDVRLLIQPGEYFDPEYPKFLPQQRQERLEWTKTGKNVGKINPSHSPYYPPGLGLYGADFRLRKDISPGQDIQFTGYIIIKGHKIPVGTLIVHVMHPA